jgi:ERCC4-type nuclease
VPSPIPKADLERFDGAIRVDDRAGSHDLVEPLRILGCTVREERLPAGDIEIIGIDGTVVGVEYKQWPDVLACVRSGRFAEQLRGMRREFHVSWLLIEGRIRIGASGKIEVASAYNSEHDIAKWREADGEYTYQEVVAWLMTMAQCGGALLWHTSCPLESALWLRSLYYWWTFQAWEEHRAHKAWFVPPPLWENPYAEPPLSLKVAALLPGVGSVRAAAIVESLGTVDEYPSVEDLIATGTVRLAEVPGIGKVTARKVWDAVRAREKRGVKRKPRSEKGAAGIARGKS